MQRPRVRRTSTRGPDAGLDAVTGQGAVYAPVAPVAAEIRQTEDSNPLSDVDTGDETGGQGGADVEPIPDG